MLRTLAHHTLDMTDDRSWCPRTLRQRINSNKRTCIIKSNSASFSHVSFSNDAIKYSKVCGKIIAYQFSSTDAFLRTSSIVSLYVDGVRLVSLMEVQDNTSGLLLIILMNLFISPRVTACRCTKSNQVNGGRDPPAFVGNDYFCTCYTGSSGC